MVATTGCESDPAGGDDTGAPVTDTTVTTDTTDTTDTTVTTDTAVADTSGCTTSDDQVCVEGDPGKVYASDSCGNATTAAITCAGDTACDTLSTDGQAYCACPLTGENSCYLGGSLSTLYEETYIGAERVCTNSVEEPNDRVEDCGFGSVCYESAAYNGGAPLCHRSIHESQADKPYYNFGCSRFSTWLEYQTKLEIDCRCRTTGDGQGGAGGTGNALADPNHTDINNGARPGGPVINCGAPGSMEDRVWPVQYGTGPSFNAWSQVNASGASWFSGVVNPATREMFAIIKWTNPNYVKSATVVAWNLDTGNRRVVSGLHPGTGGLSTFGSGYLSPKPGNTGTVTEQPLSGAHVIRLHSDGYLYTYGGGTGETTSSTREIVKIDPTTGERTLVWLAQSDRNVDLTATYGQCFRPDAYGYKQSLELMSHGFDIGPDGTFYLSIHDVRGGEGIVAISPDATTCTVISVWGGNGHQPGGGATPVPALSIGNGPTLQFPVQGLLTHNGTLHGVSNGQMYGFNLTTGDRVHESYSNSTYGGMGFANMFYDATRDVIWAVGTVAPYVGSIVDLKTGRRESIYGDTGRDEWGDEAILRSIYPTTFSVGTTSTMLTNGNTIGYGGVVLDPDNNDIVYAVLKSGALMKLELSTFNNYAHSW